MGLTLENSLNRSHESTEQIGGLIKSALTFAFKYIIGFISGTRISEVCWSGGWADRPIE